MQHGALQRSTNCNASLHGLRQQQCALLRAWVGVLQCDRSAATPATLATSYSDSSDTRRFILSSRDRGWPMPPPAPSTATLLQGSEGKGVGSPGGASARGGGAAAAAAGALRPGPPEPEA